MHLWVVSFDLQKIQMFHQRLNDLHFGRQHIVWGIKKNCWHPKWIGGGGFHLSSFRALIATSWWKADICVDSGQEEENGSEITWVLSKQLRGKARDNPKLSKANVMPVPLRPFLTPISTPSSVDKARLGVGMELVASQQEVPGTYMFFFLYIFE